MRLRLDEKNRLIEKKTQGMLQAQQERNRMNNEFTELKDHMEIKDRKISVLQRKVSSNYNIKLSILHIITLILTLLHQLFFYQLSFIIFCNYLSYMNECVNEYFISTSFVI